MVLFNYILVITWFPASVIVHERYLKDCLPWFSFRKMCNNTVAILFIASRNLFKLVEARTSPMDSNSKNHFRVGESEENMDSHPDDEDDFLTIEQRVERRNIEKAQEKAKIEKEPQPRSPLEEWLSGPYFAFVLKRARTIIATCMLLFVASVSFASLKLKPDTKAFNFFNENHMVSKLEKIVRKKFDYTPLEGNLHLKISFGLDKHAPLDRAEDEVHVTKLFNDELYYETNPMKANFDPSFDLFDHQVAFLVFCDSFLEELIIEGEAEVGATQYNWFRDFKKWSVAKGYAFPYTDRSTFDSATNEWVVASSEEDFSFQRMKEDNEEYAYYTFFAKNDEGRICFTFYDVETSLPWIRNGHTNERMWKFYRNNQHALKAAQDFAGMKGAIQTNEEYRQMVLSGYLALSSLQSLVISIIIAGAVFYVATMNWWLASLSFFFFLEVISITFAAMAALGWKINMIEAIDITICSGLAVDFVLHLSHSFNCHSGQNVERARLGIRDMGVSIFAGVGTTFCACFVLFFTSMTLFHLFGMFIAMVLVSGFLVTFTGLLAALATLGPSNTQGQVKITFPVTLRSFF